MLAEPVESSGLPRSISLSAAIGTAPGNSGKAGHGHCCEGP